MDDVDKYILVESDNENVEDNMNQLEDEIAKGDGNIVPKVGMTFKNENEMFDFYKAYAYVVGFPIRKWTSKKDDNGMLKYLTLKCSREGKRSGTTSGFFKPQLTIQTDCKTRISTYSDIHGSWRINIVCLEHNHRTSPMMSMLYHCNRKMSNHVKRKLQVNDLAGIPLHRSYDSTVVEACGYENMTCEEKNSRNYIELVRRLQLEVGDAATIQNYFSTMQSRCSGFYFSMDLDDDSHLRNVFWKENWPMQAFKEFGDVVTFDTTYLTNKYGMSFAPFVGVNHHRQSTHLVVVWCQTRTQTLSCGF
ncbi:protein FAR1-RELATED SEQUENCE 5-like isoform X2 [Olea europaea var. sylvestris]|nr:protein FAR1-RELATED SEQUENCE 5-like isoform X2 [Olea europaea var. sylvestris]XP_022850712.1 protein FAR1-RELATED SEQUENCE 5-like isoform X2 [Olea europaea var. sylvestris]XP_022850713.1 protein FAR1-RELATED SEQUENCE 5-like isoform X2 [Olea europaea var. sylvestris]